MRKLKKIIGAILIIILFIQANTAYAIYSPVISEQAGIAKKDILTSRKQNGVGTWWNIVEKAEKAGKTVNNGMYNLYEDNVKEIVSGTLASSFLDGLSLLFGRWIGSNEWISNCLRDDIWELEALQEQILNELFKAAFLLDVTNANILWTDYVTINNILRDGWGYDLDGKDGITENEYFTLKKDYRNSKVWFPSEQNYYVTCPYGDFDKGFKDLKTSFDQLIATFGQEGTLTLGSFESMANIAKERAIKKAQKWIKENQITVTIGSKDGYSPRSLINGPGLNGLAGDVNTELGFVGSFANTVYQNTKKAFTPSTTNSDIESYIKAYNEADKAKKLAADQMETALVYNLSLNNVSEESLKDIDATMFKINKTIQEAYLTVSAPQNLKTFCEKINKLARSQCKNKSGGNIPSCSQ